MYLIDLFQTKVLSVGRLARLMAHVARFGIQLSNVLYMCDDRNAIAISTRSTSLSYKELFRSIGSASGYLYRIYNIRQGSRVLVVVDNSIPSVVLLFALSALGCHIQIIGPIRDSDQFNKSINPNQYDFIFSAIEEKEEYHDRIGIVFLTSVWADVIGHDPYQPFVTRATSISIFTSGSTGIAKRAKRSNTLWQYLRAIADLVKTLQIHQFQKVMVAVPVHHSYGLSSLFLSLMLGKTIQLVGKFDASDVARDIQTNNIEVAILIPQMLSRLLVHDLPSVRCIVSCADILPTPLLINARKKFGDIIFNLYGTSETGLATVATPAMLAINSETIGRPIDGCELKLVEEDGESVLYVRSGFGMSRGYIRTGDIAFCDARGWYHLRGRVDDLLVINGTNVYPIELLEMIYKHEGIQHADVGSFVNEHGFRKIKLVLQIRDKDAITEQQFKEWWLNQYGTRFLPGAVEFNKNALRSKLM